MKAQLSSISSVDEIYALFIECKHHLEHKNIFQWTDYYPNIEIISEDIMNRELFEIKIQQKIAGVITLNNKQDSQYNSICWEDKNEKCLIIHRLAIHPIFQNQGLAKYMLAFAKEYATSNLFSSIRLDVYNGNKNAMALYEKANYIKKGEIFFPDRLQPFSCFEYKI